ncbi:hypothetical protein B0I27_102312 [Arcticibacter pallidicorallinus]|uniref:Uncharacterized protein n=1 Tax=Arcticibacter pallidicorallinus TaxID=1259464 RepID=A0A2T0U9D2_9SPHI|nr:hypothetical protein B0I27_102312 [Arcticibacter pallidicorallinus]
MSPVKIEVNCFSMLYSESGKSFGNFNLFHLFTNIKNKGYAENEFILAYGPGAEYLYYEWINETLNEHKNSNLYDIN